MGNIYENDDPVICSEHRLSYQNTGVPDITVEMRISRSMPFLARFEAAKAVEFKNRRVYTATWLIFCG